MTVEASASKRQQVGRKLIANQVGQAREATSVQYLGLDTTHVDGLARAVSAWGERQSKWHVVPELTRVTPDSADHKDWRFNTRVVFSTGNPDTPLLTVRTSTPANDSNAISEELVKKDASLEQLHELLGISGDAFGEDADNWHIRTRMSVSTGERGSRVSRGNREVPTIKPLAVVTFGYDSQMGTVLTKVRPGVEHAEGRRGRDLPVDYHPKLLEFARMYDAGIDLAKSNK